MVLALKLLAGNVVCKCFLVEIMRQIDSLRKRKSSVVVGRKL